MTPQNSWGMARHFKEHLFENLLLNRSYVSHLLSIFEREPRCGMILPPIIHIGYPTLGASWFTNRPGAEELAKKLGLKVPFDDYTPLAAYGTMYWFRPDALRPMFEHAFSWSDFPAEPGHKDGGLAHVIERLLVYTAHHRGYYAKCVLTPKNAAKNYVKLEYRLQKMIGDINCAQHPSTPVPFPKPQLERYVAQHLEGVPVVFGVTRASFRATRSLYRLAKKLVADK
jgi:rhamnosyltransferase